MSDYQGVNYLTRSFAYLDPCQPVVSFVVLNDQRDVVPLDKVSIQIS